MFYETAHCIYEIPIIGLNKANYDKHSNQSFCRVTEAKLGFIYSEFSLGNLAICIRLSTSALNQSAK